MTNESVIIKGTKEGITIILDEISSFEDVKKAIYEKLQRSRNFFSGGKVSIKIKNGFLSKDEYDKLQHIFTDFGMSLQEASSPKTLIFPKPNRNRVLLLKKTVRSGQKITYKGTIVILGDANPGSEIVAAGDILVMGTLRGMAHAGAQGDTTAIVAAFALKPTQLRIAEVISRPPEEKENLPSFPEIARLKDNVIVIEPL
ncbi:putative septum site-determining protein MinC [Tepidanaerobacter acetatoxydans Re1]|uniref:Probable septum site-determining protein MinC n=1 Tax=Tepidanaerobacter acetatoxydans (strain DSM 21804 / JCM 16047 / Re1) TaxID=1209989 RepID=F4LW12_TEPAE|nr:septum site-determining protein MinC [Tepidanaerobacter acetatoxydans]AEE91680.1 septum site-determining protein minC [Tepidanaerobacter acetatoxydans Re1]CDI40772.1 putative septum site-determining protein MinC [Tepidanaerobacter acetatoxydans Re1]